MKIKYNRNANKVKIKWDGNDISGKTENIPVKQKMDMN